MTDSEEAVSVETVGANPVRFWGLDTAERVRRIAAKAGLGGSGAPVVLASADHVFDPAWLRYYGAYKGVTDLLTKYLWPELALWLTRLAAWAGLSPNAVTAIGALLCVGATFAFAWGAYWMGMAMAFVFMVLDTVDGKLARCTVTSSWWGNVFDHGIDLVHPPFWWWFWATGLVHVGLGLSDTLFWWVQGTMIAGYVLQRAIEGAFMWQFGGMDAHVWRPFDSRFRLVTARRNPNMVILFVALLFGRPDVGIVAVAVWTAASFAVHLIRFGQALQRRARGQAIVTWLAEG